MHPDLESLKNTTRRHFLKSCPVGLAGMFLGTSGAPRAFGADDIANPLAQKTPHFPVRAKNVIYLHMAGSPSNLDMLDYKPELVKFNAKPCPDESIKGKKFAFTSGVPNLMGSPRTFKQHGESGQWVSDVMPHLGGVVDKLSIIHSMTTDEFNHAPAQLLLYTGSARQGRPSMGSWVTYGLGTGNENLPGFVVLNSGGSNPSAGKNAFGSGFLPTVYQGVQCRSKGDPVLYVSNPKGLSRDTRRLSLDALRDLNEIQAAKIGNPETRTRIAQGELAFRMQTSVPGVMDISKEPRHMLDAYGAEPGAASFANNCLLARRLVEQGVRFVQLFDWGWDMHGVNEELGLGSGLTNKGRQTDKPIVALIKDLEQRGLLDETLIVWGGEFGRTPFREGRTANNAMLGRDHYPDCFSMFMCGGGSKPGPYGETDDLGFGVVKDKVHVHDLQATILHLLGFDHTKLTYRFQGRDYRLTDVHGKPVRGVIA